MVTGADGWSPTDPAVAEDARRRARRGQGVTAIRQDGALAFGGKEIVNSIDPKTVGGLFTFDWAEGSDAVLGGLGADEAIVDEGWASEQKLARRRRVLDHLPERDAARPRRSPRSRSRR